MSPRCSQIENRAQIMIFLGQRGGTKLGIFKGGGPKGGGNPILKNFRLRRTFKAKNYTIISKKFRLRRAFYFLKFNYIEFIAS